MFDHYTFIRPEHHVALASCVRQHAVITPPMLADLYKAALTCIDQPTQHPGKITSHLNNGTISMGTATDSKTGFYVQLAKVGSGHPLLTVGAKWAVEAPNAMQGNIATLLW
jgi:hypothetical protein